MTEIDDIDGLAAEYVLGTLSHADRISIAARRQREQNLDDAIRAWEVRLAPLNDLVRPIDPAIEIGPMIETRALRQAQRGGGQQSDVLSLARRLKRWRAAAIVASSLAASLLIALVAQHFAPSPREKNLVAVLQKDAQSPAFLVSVNVEDRIMTVRPIAAKHEAGKSFELWIIHDSLGQPKSLGLIDDKTATRAPTLANYKPEVIAGSTYAVSLEPEGGSTTGAPSGPVVFSGKMIESDKF